MCDAATSPRHHLSPLALLAAAPIISRVIAHAHIPAVASVASFAVAVSGCFIVEWDP